MLRSAATENQPFIALFALWALITAAYVLFEVRLPASDVFLFKDAGVNFATTGRFVTSNLPHMPPDQELVFAYYPPVYPFVFGLWSRLVGVGLKQSILFDQTLKGIRTLWLLLFLMPYLGPALRSQRHRWVGRAVLAALLLLSFLSSDGDRPDELALCWGLTFWYFLWRARLGWERILFSSVLLGICGATSPAAGVFFGLGSIFFLWKKPLPYLKIVFLAAGSAAAFLLCNLPIHLADPEAFSRFSKQLPLSTLPYSLPFVAGHTWNDFVGSLRYPMRHLSHLGFPFFLLIGTAVGIRLLFLKEARKLAFPSAFSWGAILFVPLCVSVWTLQPFYLWFSATALVVSSFALALQAEERLGIRLFIVALQVAALLPLTFPEAKLFVHAFERSKDQEVGSIRQRVLAYVRPEAKMAVTPDQYFTFKNQRSISDVTFVCYRLDDFDYVYVTAIQSAARNRPEPIPIPCPEKQKCFTVEANLTSNEVATLFGRETNYFVRDSSGVLYRNTGCPRDTLAKQAK